VTLGHFFDTWRTNAGLAGNNGDAFVDGQANRQFDEYGIRDGDEIVIVYTSNEVVSLNTNLGSILRRTASSTSTASGTATRS